MKGKHLGAVRGKYMRDGINENREATFDVGLMVKTSGLLYFEYDLQTHQAMRPVRVDGNVTMETADDFPECLIRETAVDADQAEIIRAAFRRMDEGSSNESFTVQMSIQDRLAWFQYNLVVISEDTRDKIVCIAADVTEAYLEGSIEQLLLWKQFDGVNIIDLKDGTFSMRFYKQIPKLKDMPKQSYNVASQEVSQRYIHEDERSLFLKRTSIETIKQNLEQKECYRFTMNGPGAKGKGQLFQYSYYYLDQSKRLVLATLEDVTKIVDHDVLTGEFNRHGFLRYVGEFLDNCKDRTQYAVLFFNIRGFKAINELLGVNGGDYILRQCVSILRESSLDPIAVARFEADHFVIFMERKNLDYDLINDLCHTTFHRNDKLFHFYGRCGIYLLSETKHDVSGICDRAKMAKQFITDDYVKPYAIYNQTMRDVFIKKRELLNDLEHGVENKEFDVYYQPVYNAKTGQVVSAEALVRWIHPEYGIVPPGDFITAFEENGYISQLDMLVEKKARGFVTERKMQGKTVVPVAINLSRMDFYDAGFMKKVVRDLRETECLNELLRFEITESAYAALLDDADRYISEFKSLGAKFLLDDFGSGYSSFSTLSDFDFDILKLDIGFVRKIGKEKKVECVIRNIIQMSHELNLEVVAEGVETLEQRQFLTDNGCDYIQGFLYSKPLEKNEFIKVLDGIK